MLEQSFASIREIRASVQKAGRLYVKQRRRNKEVFDNPYEFIQNPSLFAEWWNLYRSAAVSQGNNPGPRKQSALAWYLLEQHSIDLALVITGTKLDIERRKNKDWSKWKFVPAFPHGCRFLLGSESCPDSYWLQAIASLQGDG